MAGRNFPHHVAEAYGTEKAAVQYAARLGRSYAVYGPYVNERPAATQAALKTATVAGGICWHRRLTSEWVCDDPNPGVRMRVTFKSAKTHKKVTLTEKDCDAVVINEPAFRKFVLPYLVGVYGVGYAYEALKKKQQR